MAKIQLMTLDCARVDYDHKDVTKDSNKITVDDDSIRLNEESLRRSQERIKNQTLTLGEPIDITDKLK